MKTKTRLTITLSQDLLSKVDSLIDSHTVRNRSQAIENLVRQGLNPDISTAVILAGGSKEKRGLSSLKKINNRYVLSIMIDRLKKFGITKIIICAGKNEKQIKDIFINGSSNGISIQYSREKKSLGSAGAIKNAENLIGRESFLVINDSTLTDLNMSDLFEFHQREDSIATICVKPRMTEKKYGQTFLHGNKIIKFLDTSDFKGISIVNIGLYILKPEIFDLIEKKKYLSLEADIFPNLAQNKKLSAFVFQGNWFDVLKDTSFEKEINNWKE